MKLFKVDFELKTNKYEHSLTEITDTVFAKSHDDAILKVKELWGHFPGFKMGSTVTFIGEIELKITDPAE